MKILEAVPVRSFCELIQGALAGDHDAAYTLLRRLRPTVAALTALQQFEGACAEELPAEDLEAATEEASWELWQALRRPLVLDEQECRSRIWKLTEETLRRLSQCTGAVHGSTILVDWSRLSERALDVAAARIAASQL